MLLRVKGPLGCKNGGMPVFFLHIGRKWKDQTQKTNKVAEKRRFFRKRFPKKKNFVLTLIPYYVIINQVACKSAPFCAADLRNLNGRVDV
ncbi:MAG: hypothetical protein IIW36_01155 [Clostridia bacterium]|nr:hypothetical protein [Clostridia bacterium]